MSAYEISDDPARLDVDLVHRWLAEESYWARGVSRAVVERSIAHSICLGAYGPGGQVGFARAVSDRATFAWLADVFVLEEHRGRGLGARLVRAAVDHPELPGLRRWLLATADAHALYRSLGFADLAGDPRFMALETEAARAACEAGPADAASRRAS